MFLPPKSTTLVLTSLISFVLLASTVEGQQAEFDRRIEAMEQARLRARQSVDAAMQGRRAVQDASYSVEPEAEGLGVTQVQATASPTGNESFNNGTRGVVVPMDRRSAQNRPTARRPRRFSQGSGQPIRMAQLSDQTIVGDQSPIVEPSMESGEIYSPIVGEYYEGEVIDDGCSTCGDVGGYFGNDCCGRGGCPPGPCWLSEFGAVLRNGDYFWGATSFRSPLFAIGGLNNDDLLTDESHGFYGGFNFGFPMCRLTCGLFSGQFGLRSVKTQFNGGEFTSSSREQLFLTTGFFRRVDCGFQFGMVADFLHEEWVTDTDVWQVRADFGRVYPNGTTLGFRLAANAGNSLKSGNINGTEFDDFFRTTQDNYRFYWRRDVPGGGYGEFLLGWSAEEQGIIGLDFDLPLANRLAMQAGFVYYLNDNGVPANAGYEGGNQLESYNIFVGMSFRPQGRNYYRNYDRPLFSVADNGTMMIIQD